MESNTTTPHALFAQYLKIVVEKGIEEAENLLPLPQPVNNGAETEIFFQQCLEFIDTVREAHRFQERLAAGDLSAEISQKNRLAKPARKLQLTLKHLACQTERVAEGDLDQRFQFLGDFSDSFNSLIDMLRVRSELERKVAVNENRLKTITSVIGDGVIVVDHEGRISFCNPEACNLLGRGEQTLLGASFDQMVHAQHPDGKQIADTDNFTAKTLSTKKVFRSDDLSFLRKGGVVIPVSVSCSPIIDGEKATGAVISFRDITEQVKYLKSLEYLNSVLRKQAMTDTLTDLYNRQYFNDRLRQELSGSKRYKTQVSLIMFDIDRFKQVNDTFGHLSGDDVIRDISTLIRNNVRESDVFARWGGEEFVILATQTSKKEAVIFSEKLRLLVETHTFPVDLQITCSFGVAQYFQEDSGGDFINRADTALYKAKKSGRNKVVAL